MIKFFLFVAFLFLLAACAVEPTATPTPITPTATLTPSPTTTFTATFTAIPSPTGTPTRIPTQTATTGPTRTTAPLRASVAPDPARGEELFHVYKCDSCHDVTQPEPGGFYAPNLGNFSAEAARILGSPEYTGTAATTADYIRESVLYPNVYIVPGALYLDAPGQSAMYQDFGREMLAADLEDIIAYLLTLAVQ